MKPYYDKEIHMKRSIWERCKLMFLFRFTTQFDKPGIIHDYNSPKWWADAWKDSLALGRTE